MKAVILTEIPRGYFTNMKDIFTAIGDQQKEYNWLISDYECNHYPVADIPFNKGYVWIDGEYLTEIVNKEDIQFIWGVFSGFSKENSLEEIMRYKIPIADGNEKIWTNEIELQNPLAEIEIIPWDSSQVIFISKNDNVVNSFIQTYPQSIDLVKYNV